MSVLNTITVSVVLPSFIERFLYTLRRCTNHPYDVVLIDNSRDGIWDLVRGQVSCYIRPQYNWGFAKSHNVAINLCATPFVTCANDDIEFIHRD